MFREIPEYSSVCGHPVLRDNRTNGTEQSRQHVTSRRDLSPLDGVRCLLSSSSTTAFLGVSCWHDYQLQQVSRQVFACKVLERGITPYSLHRPRSHTPHWCTALHPSPYKLDSHTEDTCSVAVQEPVSSRSATHRVRTDIKTLFSGTFQDLQRPNSRVFQNSKTRFQGLSRIHSVHKHGCMRS